MVVAGDHDQLVAQRRPDLPRAVLGDEANHADHLVHVGARTMQREERRRLDRFEDDVETFGPAMPVDLRDAGFDMPQPRFLLAQRTLHLRPLQRQHGPQFGWRDLVLEQRPDLFQRQAELLQRENAVQPRQLPDAVIAIARLGIDMGGLQQSELVVEPQLPGSRPARSARIHRSGTSELSQLAMKACREVRRVVMSGSSVSRSALCGFDAASKSSGFFIRAGAHKTGMELTDTEFLGIFRGSPPKQIDGISDAPLQCRDRREIAPRARPPDLWTGQ